MSNLKRSENGILLTQHSPLVATRHTVTPSCFEVNFLRKCKISGNHGAIYKDIIFQKQLN